MKICQEICFNCQFWIPEYKHFKPYYTGYCYLTLFKTEANNKIAEGKITDRNYWCKRWLRLEKRKTIKDMNDFIKK